MRRKSRRLRGGTAFRMVPWGYDPEQVLSYLSNILVVFSQEQEELRQTVSAQRYELRELREDAQLHSDFMRGFVKPLLEGKIHGDSGD
ncbi:hypothetical protein [Pseudoflavonifractor phocaeensis]|uniref:hypothetical protein n=1 Tax=Pseudoflavonifractor phocaeensis TaxID=1870988 RepID=UPI00210C2EB4|nr:hypothetical protein [Pseudoflavonifractor phocaeensis]MCQ4863514.1 hypothetical protein [Pseudoflavonifractor phocaeensis]